MDWAVSSNWVLSSNEEGLGVVTRRDRRRNEGGQAVSTCHCLPYFGDARGKGKRGWVGVETTLLAIGRVHQLRYLLSLAYPFPLLILLSLELFSLSPTVFTHIFILPTNPVFGYRIADMDDYTYQ
jgi:hypothetical protein